jgi:uncharacterized hydrophobic protein (TIGR00271 family)
MPDSQAAFSPYLLKRILVAIRARFSLREDRAADNEIDVSLRQGVTMQGTNLWVLMFAIFVASIGLNVSSTAVIIGAMLISPLMGPIMGIGYGAGINDFALVQRGLKNLGIATLIALVTSTVYFMITPLTGSLSELLARTTPTIWDVLIALFGGLAGIIGATRKEKSNVIPGVAIATALMPPLCTAGYGLASANWSYFFGALYLFAINSVFIATAAALVTRAFHIERKRFEDMAIGRRMRAMMIAVVTITLIPSLYLAYRMVGEEIFRTRATQFVRDRLEFQSTHISNLEIEPRSGSIKVSLIGDRIADNALADVISRLPAAGMPDAKLQVFQAGDQQLDLTTLRSNLLGDLYRESQKQVADKDDQIRQMREQIESSRVGSQRFNEVPAELNALFPQVTRVMISEAREWNANAGLSEGRTLVVNLRLTQPLSREQRSRVEAWLRARLLTQDVRLFIEPA